MLHLLLQLRMHPTIQAQISKNIYEIKKTKYEDIILLEPIIACPYNVQNHFHKMWLLRYDIM